MKKQLIALFCFGFIGSVAAQSDNALSGVTAKQEAYKREQVNIRLWERNNPHIKTVSYTDFISRPKRERDYMLMRGVLVYEGSELKWSDIELFNQGRRSAHLEQFLQEEIALDVWVKSHPHVLIMSQERYNTLHPDDKALVDATNDKIIYQGARLTVADVMNH